MKIRKGILIRICVEKGNFKMSNIWITRIRLLDSNSYDFIANFEAKY